MAYSGGYVSNARQQQLLQYAARRLGWPGLAERLEVSEALVVAWMLGRVEIPNFKVLDLVDLIDELVSHPLLA